MAIQVFSEIGKLRRVMLHRPGMELDHLVPDALERLLFDDIPYLKTAQQEHDVFAQTLRDEDVEVLYLEDLVAETIAQSPKIRDAFLTTFIKDGGARALQSAAELKAYLMAIQDPKELVLKTMAGITRKELGNVARGSLVDLVKGDEGFVMDPIPNLYFTRDPFATMGRGVSIHRMYSDTRRRETIYGDIIMARHPDFMGQVPLYYRREDHFNIEGGDILVLNNRVMLVGISQRTTPEAIEILASRVLSPQGFNVILAVDLPRFRAFMHLDTVLTQVDVDAFTVYPGILDNTRVFEITSGETQGSLVVKERDEGIQTVLAQHLKIEKLRMIRCGGRNQVASEREQWNDGSNTLCIRPGVVITYDRNRTTNALLKDEGIEVLEIPSSELSRGRGGPRCMTMPLVRDALSQP